MARQIEAAIDETLGQSGFNCTELLPVARQIEQIGNRAGKAKLPAVAGHTEQQIRLGHVCLEAVPGDIVVPGISDQAEDRQATGRLRDVGTWQVVADLPGIGEKPDEEIVDECSAGLVQMQKNQPICNDHV